MSENHSPTFINSLHFLIFLLVVLVYSQWHYNALFQYFNGHLLSLRINNPSSKFVHWWSIFSSLSERLPMKRHDTYSLKRTMKVRKLTIGLPSRYLFFVSLMQQVCLKEKKKKEIIFSLQRLTVWNKFKSSSEKTQAPFSPRNWKARFESQ